LSFAVHLSLDGGATRFPLTIDAADSFFDIDTTSLAGTNQALVRVLATDGVNTGTGESAAVFSINHQCSERDPRHIPAELGEVVFLKDLRYLLGNTAMMALHLDAVADAAPAASG